MKQRAVQNRLRQIQRPPAIRNQLRLYREELPVRRMAHGKLRVKRMALAGQRHVEVAVELHALGKVPAEQRMAARLERYRRIGLPG